MSGAMPPGGASCARAVIEKAAKHPDSRNIFFIIGLMQRTENGPEPKVPPPEAAIFRNNTRWLQKNSPIGHSK
ncbi:MAG: hypothetical protein ABF714_06160, partial [Novacetimonas hansenii]|uniref:hypothetical protein n=1 Tax=Novacetimonas hansenii TaxID=436 RepID=UPI0039EB009B